MESIGQLKTLIKQAELALPKVGDANNQEVLASMKKLREQNVLFDQRPDSASVQNGGDSKEETINFVYQKMYKQDTAKFSISDLLNHPEGDSPLTKL